jgi:hypothetical protein
MSNASTRAIILIVAAVDIGIFGIGVLLTYVDGIGDGGTAFALVAIGVLTFAGFYFATEEMRPTIAATFVVLYIVLLTTLLLDGHLRDYVSQSEFARSLITQFTALVGTVVAFYLGASAIVDRTKIQQGESESSKVTQR